MKAEHWIARAIHRLCALFVLGMAVILITPRSVDAAAPLPEKLPATGNCYADNIYFGSALPGTEDNPVLVFVHGYGGLASDWWVDVPGLLVNEAYDLAHDAGYRTAFVNLGFDPLTCVASREPVRDVVSNGFTLSRQIELIRSHYMIDEVDIVAHSKGGIEAQAAIVYWGSWRYVRNVFTVGTPHQGSLLADLLWSEDSQWFAGLLGNRDAGSFSMQTNFMELFRQTTDPRTVDDHIDYYTGAGNRWNGPGSTYEFTGAWLQDQPLGGDNDGIIEVASTRLAGAETLFLEPWNHKEVLLGQNIFPYIHEILLDEPQPSVGLVIFGPTSGYGNESLPFMARAPVTSTTPISYVWNATDQSEVRVTGGITSSVDLTWVTPGTKLLTVTAANASYAITRVHSVEISNYVAPTDLTVNGPILVRADTGNIFQATLPANTTVPVTYTWQATDQPKVIHIGATNDTTTFVWAQIGTKVITVTATNPAGTVSASHTVEVEQTASPDQLTLVGLSEGRVGSAYRFTANLPDDVGTPVIYTWEATGQPGVLKTSGTSDSVLYTWQEAGEKAVTVTAANAAGQAEATRTISIAEEPIEESVSTLFLPNTVTGPRTRPFPGAAALHQDGPEDDPMAGVVSNFILRGGPVTGESRETVVIEPEARSIEFTLLTSAPNVNAQLTGPDGSHKALTVVSNDMPDLFRNAHKLRGRVELPSPGNWNVEITSQKPAGYILLVWLDSTLEVALDGLPADTTLAPDQTIELRAFGRTPLLAPQAPITADNIHVSVSIMGSINQGVATVEDDATGSFLTVSALQPDRFHTFTVTVRGETAGGHGFERTFLRSFVVAEQTPDEIFGFHRVK